MPVGISITGAQKAQWGKFKKKQAKAEKAARVAADKVRQKQAAYVARKVKELYTSRVKVRSGLLRSSVHMTPRRIRPGSFKTVTVGTPVKYAATHEDGAFIKPTGQQREIVVGRAPLGARKYTPGELITHRGGGKRLAIPVGRALKRSRAPKHKHVDMAGVQLSGGAPFKTWISKSGRALMFSKQRANLKWTKPEAIAALKRSVTIPARRVFKTAAKLAGRKFGRSFKVAIDREWEKVK